ncbi:Os11g0648500 [Oryza sativa Japonica Group]|uniref:Os11g0648500 protein n=1 Tax=Oryza sativa subsp. japonica TaxID=39947 RepID=A0A0P0Y503_ORYSJ|nr:Os11g0648500 [Oryza sativa Japonica Group]
MSERRARELARCSAFLESFSQAALGCGRLLPRARSSSSAPSPPSSRGPGGRCAVARRGRSGMGPKRRRKGKTQVGAAARDEEPSVVVDADDADGGARSHVVAGEAAGGGGADGGSPASRAASPPPPTAAGGQGGVGGGPVSGGGGSAPGGAATAQREGAPPAAATSVQGAPRAPATAETVPQGSPRGPGVRTVGPVPSTAQSAPGGSATGQTATAQSSPRAATTTKLDIEEKGPAFGDARWRNKATGVDIDDSSRDDADGGLSKTVLSWTIQDILLDNEVQKVPTKFKGLQHYLDVHSNLLREEVRITIKSSLLKVETTQCFRDFVVSFAGPPSIYYIDIDLYGIDNCQHVVKDGDLFFLSSQPLRGQLSGCFGIATDVGCDNQFQRSFKMLVSENQKKTDLESIRYICFLTNIVDNLNISKAMVTMSSGRCGIINSIIRRNEKCKKTCACAELCAFGIEDSSYLDKYNEEQQCAMTCIMSKAGCHHNHSVDLVWGPPANRASELYVALFVWKAWVKEMAALLGLDMYCRKKCVHHDEDLTCNKCEPIEFSLMSFKKKFGNTAVELRKCSTCLIKSLSATSLSDLDVTNVNNLLIALSQFENLMQKSEISDYSVKRAFGITIAVDYDFEDCCTAKSLDQIRRTCLALTETVLSSIELPQLEGWSDLEDFCIRHSHIIISTPGCFARLQSLKMDQVDVLIVDKAAQIKENDLLVPLSIPPRHVVLLGDHQHLQPIVKTEGCKEAGCTRSLFQRLLHLSFTRHKLIKQYMMHPLIRQFPSEHFYKDKIVDGQSVESINLQFPAYTFFDVVDMEDFSCMGKKSMEAAVVLFLLQKLCEGLTNAAGRLNVGIVCFCSNQVNAIITQLGRKYQNHDRVNLEVNSLENMHEDWYDVIILSSLFDDKSELPTDNRINVALTKSSKSLTMDMEPLSETTDQDGLVSTQSTTPNKDLEDHITLNTFWHVFETKKVLQYACLDPPQDFQWNLSVDNLKSQYEHHESTEFGSEEKNKRGKHRLESALDILKVHGVIGSNEVNSEEALFRISAHNRVDAAEPENLRSIEDGNVMVGCFRLSYNYFYLKPGEVYWYDKSKPYVHSRSNLPAAHAVMVIGHGKRMMDRGEGTSNNVVRRHVVIQNSEGKRFGFDGTRRVLRRSLTHLYQMKI